MLDAHWRRIDAPAMEMGCTEAMFEQSRSKGHRCLFVIYGENTARAARAVARRGGLAQDARICFLVGDNRKNTFATFGKAVVCTYAKSAALLGKTYDALIVADFAPMTPNTLVTAFETVVGGGPIVLLFEGVAHKKELLRMRAACTENPGTSVYFRRIFKSLIASDFVVFAKSRRCASRKRDASAAAPKSNVFCATPDQNATCAQIRKTTGTMILTGPRGRGKSAVLGMCAAEAAMAGASVVVTAPDFSNAEAVFAHAAMSLRSTGAEFCAQGRRIMTGKGQIEYVSPAFVRGCDLLLVDEAAALAQDVLAKLLIAKKVVLASTVDGYEGSGKALKKFAGAELRLEKPVRYAADDPVERWISDKVLFNTLSSECSESADCALFAIRTRALFRDEAALASVFSLFAQSHYRSNPNDAMQCADNPRMTLLALCPRERPGEVLCAMQVAAEGGISEDSARDGHVIPWTLSNFHAEERFLHTAGVRVVRIAVHPALARKGVGSLALKRLFQSALGKKERLPRTTAVFCRIGLRFCGAAYVGAGFALGYEIFRFWLKNGYRAFYVRGGKNALTGEHTAIVLRATKAEPWLFACEDEFQRRFCASLRFSFRAIEPWTCLAILRERGDRLRVNAYDVARMQRFVTRFVDVYDVVDVLPRIAEGLVHSATLTALEKCVLVAVGLQNRDFSDACAVLGIRFEHVRLVLYAIFNKVVQNQNFDRQ